MFLAKSQEEIFLADQDPKQAQSCGLPESIWAAIRVVKAASRATAQGPPERGSIANRTEHRSSTDGSKEAKSLGEGSPRAAMDFSVPVGSRNLLTAAITKTIASKKPAHAPN